MARLSKARTAVAANKDLDSRARLVGAATELFVKKGYRGVSIREIADQAESNSALISYYFGDKEGLFKEVFKAVAAPLNKKRMANFDKLERAGTITVESVVQAWVAPMFEGVSQTRESPVATLSLSLNAEQGELSEQVVVEIYDEINLRFLDLLEQCLPGVARATLVWRLYFLVGAVLTAMRPKGKSVKNLSGGMVVRQDSKELIVQLVAFTAAGFRALEPAPQKRLQQVKTGPWLKA